MTRRLDLQEFLSAYLGEADEHVAAVNAKLFALEKGAESGAQDLRDVRDLFRALHTLKGLSAMVGVDSVVGLAHRMETVLRGAERSGGKIAPATIELLLDGARAIAQSIEDVAQKRAPREPPRALLDALDRIDLPAAIETALAGDALLDDLAQTLPPYERERLVAGARSGRRAVRVDFVPSAEKAKAGVTINTVRDQVSALGDLVKVVPLSVPASDRGPGGLRFAMFFVSGADDEAIARAVGVAIGDVRSIVAEVAAPAMLPEIAEEPAAAPRNVVRVDVQRIDDAMEHLSALVVTRSRLHRAVAALAERGVDVRELGFAMGDHARQLRDLRASLLRVRMIPLGDVLERLSLVVRGLRRTTGKAVRLVVEGGDVEVDKAVAERLFPALLHLVRNAVDHGIGAPEERARSGKPEEGTVTVACVERNRMVEIRIRDDGRGVDRAAVARRVGVRELAADDALLEALCRPGLSTREEATDTSGRGMGMDIVKRVVVDRLGGELSLRSEAGQGTTFTISVPLTISIVDAFTFVCAEQRFAVPVSAVEEIVELDPARLVRGPVRDGRAIALFEHRGEAVPVLDLARALRLRDTPREGGHAFVVRRASEAVAFVVDRVVGQQEAVVRPLTDPLVQVPGVSGSTDLGDGRPTLVLDLPALGGAVRGKERAA